MKKIFDNIILLLCAVIVGAVIGGFSALLLLSQGLRFTYYAGRRTFFGFSAVVVIGAIIGAIAVPLSIVKLWFADKGKNKRQY